jgi:hypothetical protein
VALNTINQTKHSSRIVVKSCTLRVKRLESQIIQKMCEQVNQGHIQNINNHYLLLGGEFILVLIKMKNKKYHIVGTVQNQIAKS